MYGVVSASDVLSSAQAKTTNDKPKRNLRNKTFHDGTKYDPSNNTTKTYSSRSKNKQPVGERSRGASARRSLETQQQHNQIQQNNVSEIEGNQKRSCRKCFLVCDNDLVLQIHESNCIVPAKTGSFYEGNAPTIPTASTNPTDPSHEKIALPLSQVPSPSEAPSTSYAAALNAQNTPATKATLPERPILNNIAAPTALSTIKPTTSGTSSNDSTAKHPVVKAPIAKPITRRKTDASVSVRSNKIQPNLPEFEEVEIVPEKPYNNINPSTFTEEVSRIYEDIVKWKKNLFQLPKGKPGKSYVKILTSWVKHFNLGNSYQGIAMKVTNILPSLLLQKPSAKSKSKEHSQLLEKRIALWEEGKLK